MPAQTPGPCCRRLKVRGKEQLIIETAAGQRITLSDGSPSVLIEDANGNSIKLESGGVTVRAAARLVLQSPIVEIDASQLTLNAGIVQCSGVLKADTVLANTVSAAAYTPGAGNVW